MEDYYRYGGQRQNDNEHWVIIFYFWMSPVLACLISATLSCTKYLGLNEVGMHWAETTRRRDCHGQELDSDGNFDQKSSFWQKLKMAHKKR